MDLLPKLRLTAFSNSRSYLPYKFDDIFSFSSGKNIKQNEASPEFSIPCVRYGELYHMYGEVITQTINSTNLDISELTFSCGNEILLPSAGEDPIDIGSASALTLKGVAIGRTINVLRPKGNIDYSHIYVSYYINEKLRKNISKLARGASISNVYNSDLKTLKANLPTLPEQQKIASFLSKVDNKIELLTKKKNKLSEYKKGVVQRLFNCKFEQDSQNDKITFIPPTFRLKADDGNHFPDWEAVTIEKIAKLEKGFTPPTHNPENWGGGIPWLSIADMNRFNGIGKTSRTLSSQGAGKKPLVKAGTLIMSFKLTIGRLIILEHDAYTNEAICHFKWFEDKVITRYAYYYLSSINISSFGSQAAKGITLNNDSLHSIVIKLPSLQEQSKIANLLSAIDQKIDLVCLELEKMKEWKKGLLQQLFV